MQIVIDIPEDVYRRLKAGDTNAGNTFHNTALASIGNGVILPKGHGDLIDINNIESIMLEDSLGRMVHIKGDEVDWYIEAPTIVEADK